MKAFEQMLISLLTWLCRIMGVGPDGIAKAQAEAKDIGRPLQLPEGSLGYFSQLKKPNRPRK